MNMRFFHLSDLHIGLKLKNRDLKEDQEYILREITDIARERKPDAVVIAGDIYDRAVPSAEAVGVFDAFLTGLREAVPGAEILVISGNHDSPQRVNCFRSLLSEEHVYMIGLPPMKKGENVEKVTLHDEFGPIHFYLLPFVKPSMVKDITGTDENGNNLSYDAAFRKLLAAVPIDPSERNILVSHQFFVPAGKSADEVERSDSEIRTVGNIDQIGADVLAPFDYAALGHIHKPMKVGSEFLRYCGTPICCSVDEEGQQKGIIEVELGRKDLTGTAGILTDEERSKYVKTAVLPLHPLHEVKTLTGTLAEVTKEPSDDYVTVLLTDEADLDIVDMQDRLRLCFPNLLEIRRQQRFRTGLRRYRGDEKAKDPMELITDFLGGEGLDEEDRKLLADVLNTAGSEQESLTDEGGHS
jgi:exonuclease SbcD